MLTALVLVLLGATSDVGGEASFVLPSGVQVRILEAPFKSQEWRVDGCGPEDKVCLINGHFPFGTAFRTPRTYVKRIAIQYQGRTHALDASDMYDAWRGRPLEFKYKGKVQIRYFGGKCFDAHNCRFRGLFSDAGGSFVAEWLIVNDRSVRTILTDSSDVVHLFMTDTNIDGPED
jgi:hypothetical protein